MQSTKNFFIKQLINVVKEKYNSQDSTISYALDQVVNVIFEKNKSSNFSCQND